MFPTFVTRDVMYILVSIKLVEINNILGISHKKIIIRTSKALLNSNLTLVLVLQKDFLGAQKSSKRDVTLTDRG